MTTRIVALATLPSAPCGGCLVFAKDDDGSYRLLRPGAPKISREEFAEYENGKLVSALYRHVDIDDPTDIVAFYWSVDLCLFPEDHRELIPRLAWSFDHDFTIAIGTDSELAVLRSRFASYLLDRANADIQASNRLGSAEKNARAAVFCADVDDIANRNAAFQIVDGVLRLRGQHKAADQWYARFKNSSQGQS